MKGILLIFQIILAVALSLAVLIQVKGTGFGRVWGGLSASSSRRGLEGLVFKMTFVFAFLFIAISLLSIAI